MECKGCGRYLFFGDRARCTQCEQHAEKLDEFKTHFDGLKEKGDFSARYAVIECRRNGLSYKETEAVTGLTQEQIGFQMDMARQDAR